MARPVVWFEVLGTDHEALQGFYGQLFGWSVAAMEGAPYAMLETGGGINGGIGVAAEDRPSGVLIYMGSEDVDADLARAAELGGRTVAGPTTMPDGRRWALLADPEGHVIGLFG